MNLFPVDQIDASNRLAMIASIDRELQYIQTTTENDVMSPPLYKQPTDFPPFQQLLQQQAHFSPRLKQCLQRRLATRHQYLLSLAMDLHRKEHCWEDQVKQEESVAVDRNQLGHQPSTHHISSLLHAQPPQQQPQQPPQQQPPQQQQPQPQTTRLNRRLDVARSEEEMNRIIQSLIEQERDNPETRWLATAAHPPLQLAATSKCQFHDRYFDHNRSITPQSHHHNDIINNNNNVDVVWTAQEERTFVDKYTIFPKNFRRIASFLPFKTTTQCVRFYYRHKRRLNLKQLVQMAQSSASGSTGNASSGSSRKRSTVYAADKSK